MSKQENQKVYVVLCEEPDGTDSDATFTYIAAVFDSKQTAEQYVESQSHYSYQSFTVHSQDVLSSFKHLLY